MSGVLLLLIAIIVGFVGFRMLQQLSEANDTLQAIRQELVSPRTGEPPATVRQIEYPDQQWAARAAAQPVATPPYFWGPQRGEGI